MWAIDTGVELWAIDKGIPGKLRKAPREKHFPDALDCAFTPQGKLIILESNGILTVAPTHHKKNLIQDAHDTLAVILLRRERMKAYIDKFALAATVKKENAQQKILTSEEKAAAWRRIKTHEGIEFEEDRMNTK